MADDGSFVSDNRRAGCGPKPTSERLIDDACERRVVADCYPMRSAGRRSGGGLPRRHQADADRLDGGKVNRPIMVNLSYKGRSASRPFGSPANSAFSSRNELCVGPMNSVSLQVLFGRLRRKI
jgi:hypothetical protein